MEVDDQSKKRKKNNNIIEQFKIKKNQQIKIKKVIGENKNKSNQANRSKQAKMKIKLN